MSFAFSTRTVASPQEFFTPFTASPNFAFRACEAAFSTTSPVGSHTFGPAGGLGAGGAAGAAVHGPLPQGLFLQRLGLMQRAAMLARTAPPRAGEFLSAAQRLVAPEAMGRLFKALCLCHPALPTPPGFETA